MNNIIKYDKPAISRRLRDLRKLNELTQDDLAKKLYVHRTTVVKWENEEKDELPSLDDMLRLCNLYDCELSYLLCEQECTTKAVQGVAEYTGLSEKAVKALRRFATAGKGSSVNACDRFISSGTFNFICEHIESAYKLSHELSIHLELEKTFESKELKEAANVLLQLKLLELKETRERIKELMNDFLDVYSDYRSVEERAEERVRLLTVETDRMKNIPTISLDDI